MPGNIYILAGILCYNSVKIMIIKQVKFYCALLCLFYRY
nr:MAG TPA: hypothetical protein [Caudoviricetes sp.]